MKVYNLSLRFLSILFCSLSLLVCAQSASASVPNTTLGSWKVKVEKTIFPSVILSLNKNIPIVQVDVVPKVSDAKVKVSVTVDGLALTSEQDQTLGGPGKDYLIKPVLRWEATKLLALQQPLPTTITVSTSINGVNLGTKTVDVRVRAVNDVPFADVDATGKEHNLTPLFAAFVNENSPIIEKILQEALHWRAVKSFDGYQSGINGVYMQVFAIWNVLQRHHVKYSSITTASGTTKGVYSQSVRFVDTTWKMQQANCVDGSVLFASVLYKIGIYPVLVHIPGHMFVGFYLNNSGKRSFNNMQFLETTMVGAGKQPGKFNMKFGFFHPVTSTLSYRQYIQAIKYGDHEFNTEVIPALRRHVPNYDIINIADARKFGINPISE